MQVYKHRQVGTLSLFALDGGALLSGAVLIFEPARPLVAGPVLVTLLLCIFLFWSLTVEVTADKSPVCSAPESILKASASKTSTIYGSFGMRGGTDGESG